MSKSLIRVFSDSDKTFLIHMDTSKYALDVLLTQINDKEKLVAVQYESRSLTKSEQMYCTFEK